MIRCGAHLVLAEEDYSSGLDLTSWATVLTATVPAACDAYIEVEVGNTAHPLAGDGDLLFRVYKNGALMVESEIYVGAVAYGGQCIRIRGLAAADEIGLDLESQDTNMADLGVIARLVKLDPAESYEQRLAGYHRVADTEAAGYNLYRGIDDEPDPDSAAFESFTTLPHVTATLDVAPTGTERTYQFFLRESNAYNLESQNYGEQEDGGIWSVTVTDAGAVATSPPSDPHAFWGEPAASGAVRVQATYLYEVDDEADRADAWLVYAKVGSDPVPGVDTPTEVAMVFSDRICRLDNTGGSYSDGQVVHVLVRTRRNGSPDVDSVNTTCIEITADTDGPAAPGGAAALYETAAGEQL